MSHHLLQRSCPKASGHQAEFHAQDRTVPNKHFPSELPTDRYGLKEFHAFLKIIVFLSFSNFHRVKNSEITTILYPILN
jgi:hypothetical protein